MRNEGMAWRLPIGLAIVLLVGAAPAAAQEVGDTRTVAVTATARVEREPDRARVQLAVEREASTAAEAMRENARAMDAVLAALRAQGVPRERIETTGLHLQPQYSRERPPQEQPPRIVGYRAVNRVRVTIDDLAGTGQVIDAAISAGANRVEGIGFEIRDPGAARQDALAEAVAMARTEAETLARAMGERLGRALSVRTAETPIHIPPMTRAVMAEAMDIAAVTPVEPGLLEVVAQVTIVYALATN